MPVSTVFARPAALPSLPNNDRRSGQNDRPALRYATLFRFFCRRAQRRSLGSSTLRIARVSSVSLGDEFRAIEIVKKPRIWRATTR